MVRPSNLTRLVLCSVLVTCWTVATRGTSHAVAGKDKQQTDKKVKQPPADLTPAEKVYGLSLFWKEASDHFAFFDKVPDLDWDKEYREAIPKVLATKSKREYYRELRRFCALLKDGHTDVTDP